MTAIVRWLYVEKYMVLSLSGALSLSGRSSS